MSGVRYNPGPMRRLARISIDLAALLSLALFAATLFLWVRGVQLDEHFWAYPDTGDRLRTVGLWSYRNGFCLAVSMVARRPK